MSDVSNADLIKECRESIEAAHDELIRIMEAGTQTRMSIPADPSRDTDLIMVAAFDLSRKALDALEAVTVTSENSALAAAESRYPDVPEHLTTPTERTVRAVKKEAFALGFLAARFRLPVPVEPEWEYDAGWRAPNGEIESNGEWSDDKDFSLDILADLLNSHGSYEDGNNTSDLPFLIRRTKAGAVEPVQVGPQPKGKADV